MKTALLNDLVNMKQYVELVYNSSENLNEKKDCLTARSVLDRMIWRVRTVSNYKTSKEITYDMNELINIECVSKQALKAREDLRA